MRTEFKRVLRSHATRYPLMEPQDYGKLAYQNHFGAEHLVSDEEQMLRRIREEWEQISPEQPHRTPEWIGGGLCRFYLNNDVEKNLAAQVLVKLFCMTAKSIRDSLLAAYPAKLKAELRAAESLSLFERFEL